MKPNKESIIERATDAIRKMYEAREALDQLSSDLQKYQVHQYNGRDIQKMAERMDLDIDQVDDTRDRVQVTELAE